MQKSTEFESFLASKNYQVIAQKDRISLALIEHVRPTHFITLSLCQGRQIDTLHGGRSWISGDDVIYGQTYEGFVRSLSKSVTKRAFWDRYRVTLRNAGTVEGGNRIERNHLHLIIAKPDDVDDDTFRFMAHRAALDNSWVMNGEYSVDIRSVENSTEAFKAASYCIKRGLGRLHIT
jgi:hypothetical protein